MYVIAKKKKLSFHIFFSSKNCLRNSHIKKTKNSPRLSVVELLYDGLEVREGWVEARPVVEQEVGGWEAGVGGACVCRDRRDYEGFSSLCCLHCF